MPIVGFQRILTLFLVPEHFPVESEHFSCPPERLPDEPEHFYCLRERLPDEPEHITLLEHFYDFIRPTEKAVCTPFPRRTYDFSIR